MYGSVGAPEGETDPKLLMRQQAEEWAETELQRRGVGKHPDAVVELADKTGYWTQKRELTKQRVAELEDEFRTDHADRGGPNISWVWISGYAVGSPDGHQPPRPWLHRGYRQGTQGRAQWILRNWRGAVV